MKNHLLVIVIYLIGFSTSFNVFAADSSNQITFLAADQSSVYAYLHQSSAPKTSATIVLFHQAGSSSRGEYINIYPRLVAEGFNVLLVDLRSGAGKFGGINQTVEHHNGKKFSYCEAYPDMTATIKWLDSQSLSGPVIIWGSSYSAGLVFQLAAKNKQVKGVLGFSPASGKPMAGCRPDEYLEKLSVPAIAFRPATEMEYASVKAQAEKFKTLNIPYISIENGVHGSSMLDTKRTKHSTQKAWHEVLSFLNQFKN